ncbi:MAG: valine--tRNA ligase, partial [Patescibacteria group bacterium]
MHDKLLKPYDPKENEERIYKLWEESGFFNPDKLPARHKEPFTIIMPPPNANGSLHAGHAVFVTIEDLIIRYKRMRGYKTLWLPGADHAGFETQVVYEKELEKEGRSRFKMDPQDLRREIMDFTLENKKFMESQLRQLGASCDWSREKFTLDPDIVKIVYSTFKQLCDDGLAYRGKRIINWCTKHQTSLSELETITEEREDPLYYMKYGPFVLATVRPETKFGDTAIAVHPNDPRYKKYVGKEIEIDSLIGKTTLKVIADEFVDMNFGTGVVKVTPAHDPNDFEIGLRHNLTVVEVIDQYGKLNEKCGKYQGLKIEEARRVIGEDLKKAGLLEKIDHKYRHAVKKCYKCERILEPRILPQWFVKMKPLAKKAISAIEKNEIIFYPEHYKKIVLHWLNNIEDWNISRQIVWGIPIPAKICSGCGEASVGLDGSIKKCPKCGGKMIEDSDTFDTWFSSGQWPFATLGFPDGKDFKSFYPTQVMETAGEIIFFWVARMIMLGLYRTEKLPFTTVYLHGIVTAKDGQKMSKSRGNVISPLELSEKYGTDALRMGLIVGNTPGTTTALYEDKIRGYKHFANKLWNIARFVLENTKSMGNEKKIELNKTDATLEKELLALIKEVTEDMENFRFYLAGEKLYHYLWHTFADKILEESKSILQGKNAPAKASRQKLLYEMLTLQLRVLHPFIPFVTEAIWTLMPHNKDKSLLMI